MENICGSRMHILDWIESSNFLGEINQLLHPTGAKVTESDKWLPTGHEYPHESKLNEFGPKYMKDCINWKSLNNWWLQHKRGANTPNWDFVSTCTIERKKGLVLVEAKAHENELKKEGKKLDVNASRESRENHAQITRAIEEAREALSDEVQGVNIRIDRAYQLSNRIAYAWKLSSMGLPVVLIYLGFLQDDEIANVGQPFRNESHWRQVLNKHMENIAPAEFVDKRIMCDGAPMWFLVRSKGIKRKSFK